MPPYANIVDVPTDEGRAAGLAKALVDASSLRELKDIYFIGNFSGRINFFAQQTRALNLVWGLLKTGHIKPYDRVAVVGGGLAGVTAAVALLNKRVQVDLFEKQPNLFHFQRQTIIRYIHPTVNFWPEMALVPSTSFPFLNWCENTPAKIIGSITREVKDYFSDIPIHFRTTAKKIETNANGLTLRTGRTKAFGPFSAVLVACGFGLEPPFKGTPHGIAHSYWENEGLLPFDLQGIKPTVFISGNGDGALIEVVRAALNNFEEGREIIELAKLLDRSTVKAEISALLQAEDAKSLDYWTSDAPHQSYLALSVPAAFRSRLKENLSSGYAITLNTRTEGKFSASSAIIHRIIVAHLINLKRVACVVGDLKTVDWSTRPVRVTVKPQVGSEWQGSASRILLRHGATRSLDWILSQKQQERLAERQKQEFANSLSRHWDDDYFNDAERFPPFESPEYFDRHLPRAREFFLSKRDVRSVAIGLEAGKRVYRVYCESAKAKAGLPERLFGVAVVGRVEPTDATAHAKALESGPRKKEMSLRPGVPVTILDRDVAREIGGSGTLRFTLPCFVSAKGVAAGIIAPLHGSRFLISPEEMDLGRLTMLSPQGDQIATLLRGLNISREQESNSHTADFGLFKLKEGVEFQTAPEGPPSWNRAASREEFFGLLGTEVFKFGAASALTRGTLDVVELSGLPIRYGDDEMMTLNGLFGVKGHGAVPFSQPGDSGSVITTSDGLLLGLVVAGAPQSNITFGIVLSQLLDELSCQLLINRSALESKIDLPRDQIFISASSKDRLWVSRLEQRLRPLIRANQLKFLNDRSVKPGEDWQAHLQDQLEQARVVVLMISPDYLSSNFALRELELVTDRAKRGDIRVLAVLLKPTVQNGPAMQELHAAVPERPLSVMAPAERDDALTRIARNVAQASAD